MRKIDIACVGLFVLLGCWRPNRVENGFSGAVQAWQDAVVQDRPRRAYELLDEEIRKKMPYARFVEEWKANRAEMLYEARRMKPGNARMTAVIHLGKTESATMVSPRRGVWKVEDAPGLRPSASSPDALLRSLAGALSRRDWPMYLSLLTPEYRHAVEEDIDQKIRNLEKAAENVPAAETGTLLRVPMDSAGMVMIVLRKINGSWRVEGFETARGGKPK